MRRADRQWEGPEKLPPVLAPDEIARFLEAAVGLRHRVALTTAYAAGLRIGEVCRMARSAAAKV
jgi:integrase/recombinase XerD